MPLQILCVWAKGPPKPQEQSEVTAALQRASSILTPITVTAWGHVNLGEAGPLPNLIGYTEEQDYVDAKTANAVTVERTRNLYLEASDRLINPVYVLFIVPAGEMKGANGFSIRSGYCSVLPVPTGETGTADGHTYAHEIAHGLSLPHVDDPNNLMFPYRVHLGKLSGDALIELQFIAMNKFVREQCPSLMVR